MNDEVLESASFRLDDPDCLVMASLACRRCLSGQVSWSLEMLDYDARVSCSCDACGKRRTVFVTPGQAFRLSLHAERPLNPTPRPSAAAGTR